MSGQNKECIKPYSTCENMFISFMITFTAGVLCFENYMPESFIEIYRTAVFVLCIGTWLALSFCSGAGKKWAYEIFTVLFWLVPLLVIYLADNGPELFRMSIIMYLLSEFSAIVFIAPAEAVGGFFGMGAVPAIFVMVLICTLAFLAGNLLSEKLKKVITL